MFNKLNALEVSKAIGVHRTSIYVWLKAGLPRNRDKSFNLPAVIAWMIQRERESVIEDHAMDSSCDSPALERFREARAKISELDLEIKKGQYVEKETVDVALSERALIFRSDLANFCHGRATEVCDMVHGDRSYIADLVQFLDDEMERVVGRYAVPIDKKEEL